MMRSQNRLIAFANWLLHRIYDEELYDEIEGDLFELYTSRLTSFGKRKASWLYLWDAILSIRNIGLRKKITKTNFVNLLLANSKFAFRIFLKDKFFATLNILGLALGISMSLIVLLVLQYDFNYDKHYSNHERIFRLSTHFTATNIDQYTAKSARALPEALATELPEIESITRIARLRVTLFKTSVHGSEVSSNETNIIKTDSNYFKIFKSNFIAGDEKSALRDPFSLVVTESTAKRYFGNDDPIGKTFTLEEAPEKLYSITGVVKNQPGNTHLKFDMIMSGLDRGQDTIRSMDYWAADVYTYMLMPENYDPQSFLDKWPLVYNKYFKLYGDQLTANYSPILQRLDQVHFHSKLDYDEPVGDITFTYVFATIGIFIILLACINYMNLSTAKSSQRASEIAMKKVLGLDKRSLALSFLTESVILSLISLLIGFVIVLTLLYSDAFNSLLERDLTSVLFERPIFFCTPFIVAIVIGLLSGLYSAIYLPGIPVLTAIKGTFKNRTSANLFRNGLITTQFSVSIFVVVCTIFMQYQIRFLNTMNLGFKKENVVVIPIRGKQIQDQIPQIKRELLLSQNIGNISTSYSILGTNTFTDGAMMAERDNIMEQQRVNIMAVGDDYFKTMGIEFEAGDQFPDGSDAADKYICNEATARLMGWGDNPIGKKIKSFGGTDGVIIGMVKNFNYNSLRNSIQPLLVVKSGIEGGYLHVRITGSQISETLEFIQGKLTSYNPDQPFDYFFLDQRLNEYYKTDLIQQKLISWLSCICIFISFLGIVGLSAFNTEQRSKEIGIRKILGASVSQIIFMMSRDALLLVIISAFLVAPVSYWIVTRWLENFAYQAPFNYLIYVVVTMAALGFVLLTIAFQSFRTAQSNPVDSLKYE